MGRMVVFEQMAVRNIGRFHDFLLSLQQVTGISQVVVLSRNCFFGLLILGEDCGQVL